MMTESCWCCCIARRVCKESCDCWRPGSLAWSSFIVGTTCWLAAARYAFASLLREARFLFFLSEADGSDDVDLSSGDDLSGDSEFEDDEFVIYNAKQQRMTHLFCYEE